MKRYWSTWALVNDKYTHCHNCGETWGIEEVATQYENDHSIKFVRVVCTLCGYGLTLWPSSSDATPV
jgi:hypothetical protein